MFDSLYFNGQVDPEIGNATKPPAVVSPPCVNLLAYPPNQPRDKFIVLTLVRFSVARPYDLSSGQV